MQRPPWSIVGDRIEVVLTTWAESRPDRATRLDRAEAGRTLRRALGPGVASGLASRPLLEAARYVSQHRPLRVPVRGDGALSAVLEALARGVLVAWVIERKGLGLTEGAGGGSAADDLLASEGEVRQKTWIEVELLDMDGKPMRGEPYWVKLPDGTVREGSLDEHGRAYFGDLDPGSAEIRWPNRDGEATEGSMPPGQGDLASTRGGGRAAANRVGGRTWVEIELLDMAGQPVPYERYWIKLPDGTVREGVLDAQGCAYFDDLDPGQCLIRWPARDEEAAFLEPDATTPGSTDQVAAQVETMVSAARDGTPFCEECERARRQQEAEEAREAEAETQAVA